jgi:glyoxylase-like metal-dependent hydrolase (beta-lactamase superfamily II)
MTHLHADHTGGMPLLPNAEFVIDRREWAAVTNRNPLLNGSTGSHLPPAERVREIDFARDGTGHGPFSRALDLFEDWSVRLLSTPGHSPGHLSVLLHGADRDVLVVGDAAYTSESIRHQLLPLFSVDTVRYRASLSQIKSYAEAEPDAIVIPTHDPDAWRALNPAHR